MKAGSVSVYDPVQDADERLTLRSAPEITAVLRSLQKQRAMISVYFDQGREFILTAILAVNPEFQEIVLDLGADERTNKLLLQSTRLLVVGNENRIKVQFVTGAAQATMHEGHPAFRVRIPGALLRIQRRDFYRVELPMSRPAKAYLQASAENPEELHEARVVDISCGGLALVFAAATVSLETGQVYPACSVNLPGIGTVWAPVEITYLGDVPLKNGILQRRAGCRFINLPGPMQAMIQRYINQVERERHLLRR